MIKKIIIGLIAFLLALFTTAPAFAEPTNQPKGVTNPQIVAFFTSGDHAIPTDPIQHLEGTDLVMLRGDSGQIEQWYTDTSGHGFHSVWNLTKDDVCPTDWVLVKAAFPSWGDYLTPGADYCVHTNAF